VEPGNHFRQCAYCHRLAQLLNQEVACPAALKRPMPETDYQDLYRSTPFDQWRTPAEIGYLYGYSSKHVIRLVTLYKTHIMARRIDGRWMVLICSFALYLDETRSR
jgi:hypothetical protein